MAEQAKLQIVIDAVNQASRELKKLQDDLGGVEQKAKHTDTSIGKLKGGVENLTGVSLTSAAALAAVGAALISTGKSAVGLAMQAEQNAMAFEVLLGSADAAREHLEDLSKFAASTPFQFTDLVDASKKLQALGFEAQAVVPMLTALGDAAAAMGGGEEMISRLTMALGQMQAKGKASGEELLQLTEAGIPAMKYLARQANVSTAEMTALVSKGLVPADEAIQAILAGVKEDFGGMMARQAETAAGKVSNLEDAVNNLLTAYGKAATDMTGDAASGLSKFLTNYAKAVNATLTEAGRMGGVKDTAKWLYLWSAIQEAAGDTRGSIASAAEATRILDINTATLKEKLSGLEQAPGPQYFQDLATSMNAVGDSAPSLEDATKGVAALEEKMRGLSFAVGSNFTQSNEEYEQTQADLTTRAEELRTEIDKLKGSQGQYYETVRGNGMTTAELELATQKLAAAQAKLAEETDPLKAAQLAVEIEKQQTAISGADQVVGGYVDNSKKIGELEAEYAEVQAAIKEVADEHDKATKRMLFNMLQQKLATDGITNEEYNFLMRVAKGYGIIDQDAYDAGVTMNRIAEEAATTGDWDTAAKEVWKYTNALNGIPTNVTVDVITRFSTQGTPSGVVGDENYGGWTQPTTDANGAPYTPPPSTSLPAPGVDLEPGVRQQSTPPGGNVVNNNVTVNTNGGNPTEIAQAVSETLARQARQQAQAGSW